MLGLEVGDLLDYQDRFDFILSWAALKSKSDDIVDKLYAIKEIQRSLGYNDSGREAVNRIYSYLRLSSEQDKLFDRIKQIKKEKELLKS